METKTKAKREFTCTPTNRLKLFIHTNSLHRYTEYIRTGVLVMCVFVCVCACVWYHPLCPKAPTCVSLSSSRFLKGLGESISIYV